MLFDPALCPDCKAKGADPKTCNNCTEECNPHAYVNGSRLCGQCLPNFSLDGLSGKCKLCPTVGQNTALAVVGFISGIIFIIIFIQLTLSDKGDVDESDGVKNIGMNFIQLITLLQTFPIQW